MINKGQLRDLISRSLQKLEDDTNGDIKYSEDAVELLMMTAAHESRLGTYIKQKKGPALGIFQMEPTTHNDIRDNFLRYKKWDFFVEDYELLEWDLDYAIVMARIHYYRVPKALPKRENPMEMAGYAKAHYNTHLGKATVMQYKEAYETLTL